MKPKTRMLITGLTHGAALMAGGAIAVALTYHSPSQAQAQPAAAPIAERRDAPQRESVTVVRAAGSTVDEDSSANAFDPITAQIIRSERGYREWLEQESSTPRY